MNRIVSVKASSLTVTLPARSSDAPRTINPVTFFIGFYLAGTADGFGFFEQASDVA
jgi:hypothetical protein